MRTLTEDVGSASAGMDWHEIELTYRNWAGDVDFGGLSFEISPGKARNGIFSCVVSHVRVTKKVQRDTNIQQKSYYDFIYFSNHSLKSFADLTGAQFKSFRNCHLLYKGRIVIVHTYIRINEITRNTSPNHSTMHGKLSHLPFNRV